MTDTATPPRWPHLLLTAVLVALCTPGLGYRHLWLDEVDTAERTRTVLESGYPRVVDERGFFSLNTAGREIEDGDVHRYTPWVQYYVAAPGLAVAMALDLDRDKWSRVPFVLCHAATSGVASYALAAFAGVPLGWAIAVGGALGLQSVRLVYNRTVRYHAPMDLLSVVGLAGLAALWARRRSARWILATSIFLLPQTHSMSGSAIALTLGVLAWSFLVEKERFPDRGDARRVALLFVALPGLASALLLTLLTRPWAQAAWGAWERREVRGLDNSAIRYAFIFSLACSGVLVLLRERAVALRMALCMALLAGLVSLMDWHPMSTHRYYLSVPLVVALWPLTAGLGGLTTSWRHVALGALCLALLFPDFQRGMAVSGNPLDFQGLRRVFHDAEQEQKGTRQPMHEVVDILRLHAAPDEPILMDAVPQYVNWYLYGRPIALLPDVSERHALNHDHPVWERVPPMPEWHLWYPTWGAGPWTCHGHCDYRAELVDAANPAGQYWLISGRRNERVLMCPVRAWLGSRVNNAPFEFLATGNLSPEGFRTDVMVLARPCARVAPLE
ncbi:MAG: hypothetical protein AB2A00_31950 [Myxococcota bacterium]